MNIVIDEIELTFDMDIKTALISDQLGEFVKKFEDGTTILVTNPATVACLQAYANNKAKEVFSPVQFIPAKSPHHAYADYTGYVGTLKDDNKEILIIVTIPMGKIGIQDNINL